MNETSQRLREGWPTLLLLGAMLLIAGIAVFQADLVDGLQVLPIISTIALLLGWLLAKSEFSDSTAHLFATVYGVFFVFFLVGSTLPDGMLWRERVFDLLERQVDWLRKAIDGGTSRDGMIFVLQTAAVFWLLGYLAAWYTFRKNYVWSVVVPIGLVLMSVVYYYTGPRPLMFYLALYALLALLYVAVTHLLLQERAWRSAQVRYDEGVRLDFVRSGAVVALITLLVAWSLPPLQANAAMAGVLTGQSSAWRSFQDTWTRLFSSLRSYGSGTSDPYQDSLVLGGPRTVSNTLVMDIYVPDELPYGVYWHAISYDTYQDGRWFASETGNEPTLHYPEDGRLDIPTYRDRVLVTQTVTNYLPNSTYVYAAPDVIGTNRQMYVDAAMDEGGNLLVKVLQMRYLMRQGDTYEVVSRVSMASADSLRAAGTGYPTWVTERYLQLPDTITPRTLSLAAELTAAHDNPYDKAVAVQDYLRSAITYNDQIDAPPDGVDPVDYVIFDLREGYCNYYASAMAVMLRSQGVPARVAGGYALGDYTAAADNYRVRTTNLHTWVEVFFPEYGWIQFEPTAAIPVFDRPTLLDDGAGEGSGPAIPQIPDDQPQPDGLEEDVERADSLSVPPIEQGGLFAGIELWQIGLALGFLAAAAAAVVAGGRYNHAVEADVDRSFGRLGEWARRLGVRWRPSQTPFEQAEALVKAVPEGERPIRTLTEQYSRKRFSAARAAASGFNPSREWQNLRPLLIRRLLSHWLRRS